MTVDNDLKEILTYIWQEEVPHIDDPIFTIFRRSTAQAASMGLITTKIHNDIYGSQWFLTDSGLNMLESLGVPLTHPEDFTSGHS